jgi:tetrapyrrole methylase family protein/MazG family protein
MSDSPTKAVKPSHPIPKNLNDFTSFVQIVAALRSPGGCPWDLEQTHQSLTPYAMEEVCELIEALERGSDQQICEELGDVLLQVVLHARLAEEEQRFNMTDVIRGIGEKMIRRHPHVFGDTQVADAQEVLDNWQKIKASESKAPPAQPNQERFDVPLALPALQRAAKIGQKTRRLKFDWTKPEDVMLKVDEEVAEMREALVSRDRAACQHEIGDLLFSVAQLARHLDLDP